MFKSMSDVKYKFLSELCHRHLLSKFHQANISIKENAAKIIGVNGLAGAKIQASDLRASAGLILSALSSKGKTEIFRIYHLDRGYERIDDKLKLIGAKIWREKE